MEEKLNDIKEIIVDNFAGGGGASVGIELACGRPIAIAVNHDPDAITLHKTNHPNTVHLQASVWDVDPVEVCDGRQVGLAWFSPDCKHFSRAKGAALVNRNIRGLAWIVLRWAGTVKPRVIMLENVEEFQTWGPVKRGHPIKSKQGMTFQKWLRQLKDLGYEIEYKVLSAADYGAPTSRKRFVLIARCDGKKIVWPNPTHGNPASQEVKCGAMKPWRTAAEIIDWSIPGYSIFDSKEELKQKYGITAVRPLADNTMRRIIRGVDKFTIKSAKPFIVNFSPEGDIGAANLIQYHTESSKGVRGYGLDSPIKTIDSSNRYGLAVASLVEYYGNGNPLPVSEPMHTITSRDREALTAVHIAEFKGNDIGQPIGRPLRTITASAGEFAVIRTTLSSSRNTGYWPQVRELLNKFCGYDLKENEILVLMIQGVSYFITDITLRMLASRELYNAMGFPPDYKIDRDYNGNTYSKTKQVARCGNAVCPPMAEAVVRANIPEWCVPKVNTMSQLNRIMDFTA